MKQYTETYFKNKQQQHQIRQVLLEALGSLPQPIEPYNLTVVLAEILKMFTEFAFADEIYGSEE